MDEKPNIDQEARRLDLRADERNLDRAFSLTKIVLIAAIIVVVAAIGAVYLLRG
jgi:hypothetical protein